MPWPPIIPDNTFTDITPQGPGTHADAHNEAADALTDLTNEHQLEVWYGATAATASALGRWRIAVFEHTSTSGPDDIDITAFGFTQTPLGSITLRANMTTAVNRNTRVGFQSGGNSATNCAVMATDIATGNYVAGAVMRITLIGPVA